MKKLVLLFVAALFISGVVWAQPVGPSFAPPTAPPSLGRALDNVFLPFSAVMTESTESRYSAGIFSSDVDDYIDVNWHDPKIGTFFFLGGFPASGQVDETGYITPNYAVNFGLGKTISSFYLGLYYSGSLVNSVGVFGAKNQPAGTEDRAWSYTEWQNNLAVLFGTPAYGAFRLDLTMNTNTELETWKDELTSKNRQAAPSVALTWGGLKLAGLDPYITIGIKFSDLYIQGADFAGTFRQYTVSYNGGFGIQAGVNYDLTEDSSVYADLAFVKGFATDYSGDTNNFNINGFNTSPWNEGGAMGFGFAAGYSQKLHFGKVSVGFSPALALAYWSESGDTSRSGFDSDPSDDFFEIATGIDLGLRYQHNAKFALYTGASLSIFDWIYASHSGGKDKDDSTAYYFAGMQWNSNSWASGKWGAENAWWGAPNDSHLGIGMTFTPAENLIIGAGLNTFLDKLFFVDFSTMTVSSGQFFQDNGEQNVGSWAGGLFRDLVFDLTVSYKF